MKKTLFLSLLCAVALTGCGVNSLSGTSTTGNQSSAQTTQTTQPAQTTTSTPPAQTAPTAPTQTPPATTTPTKPEQTTPTSKPGSNNTSTPAPSSSQPVVGNPPPSESVTADQIVSQFYADLHGKMFKRAWSAWLNTDDQKSQSYDQFVNQKVPTLVSVSKPTYVDSYTFHSFNKTISHVAVVTTKFSDGSTKTIHAALDDQGWKLAWNPTDGLE